jgi:hypothetical protein
MKFESKIAQNLNRLISCVPLLACAGSLIAATILCKIMLGRFWVYGVDSDDVTLGWLSVVPIAFLGSWLVARKIARARK